MVQTVTSDSKKKENSHPFYTVGKFSRIEKNKLFADWSQPKKVKILDIVFATNNEIYCSSLVSQKREAVKSQHSENVGQSVVKSFITYCRNNKLVCKEKDRAPYTRNAPPKLPF